MRVLFKLAKDGTKILKRLEEKKFTPQELKEIREMIPESNEFYWWDEENKQEFIRDKQGKMWSWKEKEDDGEPKEKETEIRERKIRKSEIFPYHQELYKNKHYGKNAN